MKPNLVKRVAAEFLGTLLLVATVVGSDIMAERLAGGNVALALLANTIATGATLVALILTFGSISDRCFTTWLFERHLMVPSRRLLERLADTDRPKDLLRVRKGNRLDDVGNRPDFKALLRQELNTNLISSPRENSCAILIQNITE